jgi:hypothetical protein
VFYYGSAALCWTLAAFSVSWSFTQSVGLLGRGSACRKAATCTHRTAQTQNKRTQTPMPRVGFELTIPMFERAKTGYVLDRAATVIGRYSSRRTIFCVHRILPMLLLTKRPTSGVWLTREVTHKRGVLLCVVFFMCCTCRESVTCTVWIDKSSCSGFLKIVTA